MTTPPRRRNARARAQSIAAALALAALSACPAAAADFRLPNCIDLERFVSVIPLATKDGDAARMQTASDRLSADAKLVPLVGTSMSRWSNEDLRSLSRIALSCVPVTEAKERSRMQTVLASIRKRFRELHPLRADTAQVSIRQPTCVRIGSWAAQARGGKTEGYNARIATLFADDKVLPLFGVSFPLWKRDDFVTAHHLLRRCADAADERNDMPANISLRVPISHLLQRAEALTP